MIYVLVQVMYTSSAYHHSNLLLKGICFARYRHHIVQDHA